jgi:hypothetical protein
MYRVIMRVFPHFKRQLKSLEMLTVIPAAEPAVGTFYSPDVYFYPVKINIQTENFDDRAGHLEMRGYSAYDDRKADMLSLFVEIFR